LPLRVFKIETIGRTIISAPVRRQAGPYWQHDRQSIDSRTATIPHLYRIRLHSGVFADVRKTLW